MGAAISLAALTLLSTPALTATPPPAPPLGGPQDEHAAAPPPAPLELQRQALRRQALESVAAGGGAGPRAAADGTLPRTAKIGKRYVELA